jgi:N-acetylglucosaminyl-diphospho-decaprenol L-rhamnosyltransferase
LSNQNFAITFACYNQVDYTLRCIQSLQRAGVDLSKVVAVDNHSSDETLAELRNLPLGQVIANSQNYGCGVAWNQGAMALQAEWTIVMNNDIVVSANWLNGLLTGAQKRGWLVASPAMIEGALDYDLEQIASQGESKLAEASRDGLPHAVCMAIHRSVWQKVGFFRATPRLLGYEDSIFFAGLKREGIPRGTLGSSWIHHFGSVTQSAMKREQGLKTGQGLGDRLHAEMGRKNWLQRKLDKHLVRSLTHQYKVRELAQTGMSLHGERKYGNFVWL